MNRRRVQIRLFGQGSDKYDSVGKFMSVIRQFVRIECPVVDRRIVDQFRMMSAGFKPSGCFRIVFHGDRRGEGGECYANNRASFESVYG